MNKTPFKFALPSVSINPELFTDVPASNLIVGLILEVILDDSIVPAFSKVKGPPVSSWIVRPEAFETLEPEDILTFWFKSCSEWTNQLREIIIKSYKNLKLILKGQVLINQLIYLINFNIYHFNQL